ncbi:GAF domain-containing protein [Robiginitalea myxolifaciens]|nr:GAF domain-containing protein [Robiginitalea myxolifaciens]
MLGNAHGQRFQYRCYQGDAFPFERVNQTVQDSEGYVWSATDNGLFRFDGKSYEDFNLSLRSKTIRSFERWNDSTLLFTNDTGIYKLEPGESGPEISAFANTLEREYPTTLFKDSQARLWSGRMDGSIVLYTPGQEAKRRYHPVKQTKTKGPFFGEDGKGTIWALYPQIGLFFAEKGAAEFEELAGYDDANHFYVEDSRIWIVGKGITEISLSGETPVEIKSSASQQELYYITRDNSGVHYTASHSALYTFDSQSSSYALSKVFGSNDPHRVEELPLQGVSDIQFTVNAGSQKPQIWVSSEKGLCLLWTGFFQNISGLGYDNVTGLYTTEDDQILLSQGPVHRILNTGGEITYNRVAAVNGITGMASKGPDTWYGSTGGVIYHYRNDILVNRYDLSDRGSGIFFMSRDHQDAIWFCQATSDKPLLGVAKLDAGGKVSMYGREKGFESRILVIREGGREELYAAGIGEDSYLYKYNWEADVFENKSLPFSFEVSSNFEVHDIAVDDSGIVWMASTDGLLKYDTETVRQVNLGPYTPNEVRAVTAMPNGQIWIATDTNGLIHLSPTGDFVVFDEESGTPSKVASYRCLALDNQEQLWVGTAEGLVYSAGTLPAPLPTQVPKVRAATLDNAQIFSDTQFEIREGQQLQLEMTTLTFPSSGVSYQYKVFLQDTPVGEVGDFAWIMAEEARILPQNLLPGAYEIWIRAQQPGGYSWSEPSKVQVAVSGKWYTSWWGMLFLGLIGFLFFWFILRRWFLTRISGLEESLDQKQSEIVKKEAELKSTGTNVYMLERLIRQMPKNGSWEDFWPTLTKLIELPTGIDAFEIAAKKKNEVVYHLFERAKPEKTKRLVEFNEKDDLASYVMVNGKPLLLSDYDTEASRYIGGKSDRGFASRVLVPFHQKKGSPAVLCVYRHEPEAFSPLDYTLIQILGSYLGAAVNDELQ